MDDSFLIPKARAPRSFSRETMQSMDHYSKAALERLMKIQEVLLRTMALKITGSTRMDGYANRRTQDCPHRSSCPTRRHSYILGFTANAGSGAIDARRRMQCYMSY
jgi:hypothetical protein